VNIKAESNINGKYANGKRLVWFRSEIAVFCILSELFLQSAQNHVLMLAYLSTHQKKSGSGWNLYPLRKHDSREKRRGNGKGGGNGKGKIERLEQNKGKGDKEGQRSEGKKGKWGRKEREGGTRLASET